MKKMAIILSFIIGVFLISGLAAVALAGVEPTPFQPEINKLGAITQNLDSIKKRVNVIMPHPPNPIVPSPYVNGVVYRLEAINNQLNLLNALIDSIMIEIIDWITNEPPTPPDPILPADVVSALISIRDASQGIVDVILELPPDPALPEAFIIALDDVKASAQAIANNVSEYIDLSECGVCSGLDPFDCIDAGCQWVMPEPPLIPFCCTWP